jgi:hypothetical protein
MKTVRIKNENEKGNEKVLRTKNLSSVKADFRGKPTINSNPYR